MKPCSSQYRLLGHVVICITKNANRKASVFINDHGLQIRDIGDKEEEISQIEWEKIIKSQQELLDFKQHEIDRLKLKLKNERNK